MRNFRSIESLRAWMAWWVVLAHALQYSGAVRLWKNKIVNILSTGTLGVDVFIIISGFVITHLLLSRREKYPAYITRRAFRIVPVYYVCLAISILSASLYTAAFVDNAWTAGADVRLTRLGSVADMLPAYLGLHALLLHGVVPEEILPFSSTALLGPAWSLSLEWQFYLVAPLMIAGLIRYPLAVSSLLLSLFVVVSRLIPFHWEMPAFLPLALPYFLLGIASRLVLDSGGARRIDPRYFVIAIPVILFATSNLPLAIWALFFLFMLIESGRVRAPEGVLRAIANGLAFNGVVATIGRWSYSTYLIHIPTFAIVVGGGRLLFGLHSQTSTILLMAASLPIIFVASWLLFHTIEAPFNRLGAGIAKRWGLRQNRQPLDDRAATAEPTLR